MADYTQKFLKVPIPGNTGNQCAEKDKIKLNNVDAKQIINAKGEETIEFVRVGNDADKGFVLKFEGPNAPADLDSTTDPDGNDATATLTLPSLTSQKQWYYSIHAKESGVVPLDPVIIIDPENMPLMPLTVNTAAIFGAGVVFGLLLCWLLRKMKGAPSPA